MFGFFGLCCVVMICAFLSVLKERYDQNNARLRQEQPSRRYPPPLPKVKEDGERRVLEMTGGRGVPAVVETSLQATHRRAAALTALKMREFKARRAGAPPTLAGDFGFCWLDLFDEADREHLAWCGKPVLRYNQVLELGVTLYSGARFDQFVEDSIALAGAHSPQTIEENLGVHSAFDQAIDRFTAPANIQALEAFTFPFVAQSMERLKQISPWHFSGASKAKAIELGVPTSDFFPEAHSHPLHASLRRMQLCEVLPHYMKTRTLCVSMSEANFDMLEKRVDVPLRLCNPVMELKDLGRYSKGSMSPDVFSIPKFDEETMVCLDSGHYQTPENMIALFKENPTLRVVVLTHVYPLAAVKSPRSPEPNIATWARDGDDMVYVPEGDTGGAYRQPWSNPLLLAHRLSESRGNMELSCGVVWSKLHSHVQVISRYPLTSLQCVALKADAYMEMPQVLDKMPPTGLIPVKYYTRLVDYGRAVQVRDRDLYGKIRQQVNNGEYSLNIVEKDCLVLAVMAVLEGFKMDLLPTTLHSTLGGYLNHRFLAGPVRRYFYRKIWGPLNERNCKLVAEPNELQVIPTCALRVRAQAGALIGYDMSFCNDSKISICTWRKMTDLKADQGLRGKYFLPPQNPKWRYKFGSQKYRDLTTADFKRVVLEDAVAEAAQLSLFDEERARVLLTEARREMEMHQRLMRKRLIDVTEQAYDFTEREGKRAILKTGEVALAGLKLSVSAATGAGKLVCGCLGKCCCCKRKKDRKATDPVEVALPEVDDLEIFLLRDPEDVSLPASSVPSEVMVPLPSSRASTISVAPTVEVEWASGGGFNLPTRLRSSPVVRPVSPPPELPLLPTAILPELPVVRLPPPPMPIPTSEELRAAVEDAYNAGLDHLLPEGLKRQWRNVQLTGMLKPKLWQSGTAVATQWNEVFPKSCNRRMHDSPYRIMSAPRDLAYPSNDCILETIHSLTRLNKLSLMATIACAWPLSEPRNVLGGLPEKVLDALGARYEFRVVVNEKNGLPSQRVYGLKGDVPTLMTEVANGHMRPVAIKNQALVIQPGPIITRRREDIVDALTSLPVVRWRDWVPGTARGEKFVREMIRGSTGTLYKWAINEQALQGWEEGIAGLSRPFPIPRKLAVVEGDPGCRKSSAVQKVFKQIKFKKNFNYQVSLQTGVLCQDWKDKLNVQEKLSNGKGLPDGYCTTFEKALAKGFPCKVFVTDEDKLPPGYMELKAYLSPNTSHFLRLGDRFQARWHEPNGDCLLNGDMSEGEFFSEWAEFYIQGTWRFGGHWANFFQMPTFARTETQVFITDMIPTSGSQLHNFLNFKSLDMCQALHEVAMTLYPSDAQVRAATALTSGDVVSHSGSQGRGEDLVYVVLDETALKAEDLRTLYACLTRVKKYMIIGLTYGRTSENIAREGSHPLFSRLRQLMGNTAKFSQIRVSPRDSIDIKSCMGGFGRPIKQVLAGPHDEVRNRSFLDAVGYEWPTECLDPDGTNVVGRSDYYRMPDRDDPGYQDNAQTRVYLDQCAERRLTEAQPFDLPLPGTKVATHLPIASRRQWIESQVAQCGDRLDQELIYKSEFSDQFPDRWMFRHDAQDLRKKLVGNVKLRKDKRALSDKLKQISADNPLLYKPMMSLCGQDQKPADHVSFMRGVKERLKRSTFRHNELIYKNGTAVYGVALFQAVMKAFKLKDSYPWDHIRFEGYVAEFAERRSKRSAALKTMSLPRSEPEFRQFITAKRQMKVKPEIPTSGKPLQTLMIHCDYYLYALGPINMYMTDFFLDHCPPNIYLHVKKTFADFDAFAKKMMSEATDPWEGDGKHFETSLDHNATYAFEQLMRVASVPEYYIQIFLDYKMHAVSQLMIHFFMTMSGEAFTWLINTIKNIAETHCRYSVPPTAPQIYGGDDESHAHRYPVNPNWHVWKEYETCELKQTYTKTPRSFSYYLTKHGAVKDPVHLLRKLLIAEERGKLEDVLAGYAIEARSLFIKGDLVFEILPEEAVDAWQLLNSELFNILKRVKIDLGTVDGHRLMFIRPLIPTSVKHWALGFISDIDTEYTSKTPNSPFSREVLNNFPVLSDHIQHNEEIEHVL
jgi:hypothetical protein